MGDARFDPSHTAGPSPPTRMAARAVSDPLVRNVPTFQPEGANMTTLIEVRVEMPHTQHYGHEGSVRYLTYGCGFPVRIGDTVMCPPTRLWPKWSEGIVVSIGTSTYAGPVKDVKEV